MLKSSCDNRCAMQEWRLSTLPWPRRITGVQPAPAADGGGPDRVLDEVVVDLEPPVTQVPHQSLVFITEVVDGFAQGALRQQLGLQFLGFDSHRLPDRRGLLLTQSVALDRREAPGFVFNPIQQPDLKDEPERLGAVFPERGVEVAAGMSLILSTR